MASGDPSLHWEHLQTMARCRLVHTFTLEHHLVTLFSKAPQYPNSVTRGLKARSEPHSIKLIAEVEHKYILDGFEGIMQILVTRSDYWLTFDSLLPPECQKTSISPMLTSVSLHPPTRTLLQQETKRFGTRFLPVTECLNVLRQSPNLQECHFGHVYSQDIFISKTIMPHARLKHLHVMLNQAASMSLFGSITLPSLSKPRIQHYGLERLFLSSITSLFLRSACNLERFSIESPFDNVDLIPCLEAIPSLSYLHLEMLGPDMGLTKKFMASLDPFGNSSRLLLPNLKCLEYKVLLSTWWLVDGIYPMAKLLRVFSKSL